MTQLTRMSLNKHSLNTASVPVIFWFDVFVGFTNLAEISRVLDISTNPNSLFLGRAKNANVGEV